MSVRLTSDIRSKGRKGGVGGESAGEGVAESDERGGRERGMFQGILNHFRRGSAKLKRRGSSAREAPPMMLLG